MRTPRMAMPESHGQPQYADLSQEAETVLTRELVLGSSGPEAARTCQARPVAAALLLLAGGIATFVVTRPALTLGQERLPHRTLETMETKKHIHIWEPDLVGEPVDLKVLTYNLFWWKLFGKLGGQGGISGRLIASHNNPPFDFMGFQECEDPWRVLGDGGLLGSFESFVSAHGIAMAYNKRVWRLLAHGQTDVAADVPGVYSFGARGAMWMRLQRIGGNQTVFFLNHHGPLPINSGGKWGWWTTAHNLLTLIQDHGRKGDAVIFVGDFNSDQSSRTVVEIKKYLHTAYSGSFMNGIDNVFTNIKGNVLSTANLGHGGSDHDALTATVSWGPHQPTEREVRASVHGKVGKVWVNVMFEAGNQSWSNRKENLTLARCVTSCQRDPNCHAWVWEPSHKSSPRRCRLLGREPAETRKHAGSYSGVPLKAFRGKCKCECSWATSKDVCQLDDGTCCWLDCCRPFVKARSQIHI